MQAESTTLAEATAGPPQTMTPEAPVQTVVAVTTVALWSTVEETRESRGPTPAASMGAGSTPVRWTAATRAR